MRPTSAACSLTPAGLLVNVPTIQVKPPMVRCGNAPDGFDGPDPSAVSAPSADPVSGKTFFNQANTNPLSLRSLSTPRATHISRQAELHALPTQPAPIIYLPIIHPTPSSHCWRHPHAQLSSTMLAVRSLHVKSVPSHSRHRNPYRSPATPACPAVLGNATQLSLYADPHPKS